MRGMNRTDAIRNRIMSAVFAHLVADALGVPYEFNPPEHIPARDLIAFTPPKGFRRSHAGAPAGAYSDDGATFLALLASLVICGGLDLDDFSRRLVNWLDRGYMAVDGKVFDVGAQTSSAIARLRSGVRPESAAAESANNERANGNGSLMRVLAIALWHTGSDEELVKLAMRSSLPTHAHPRSLVCCAAYALWARYVLGGEYVRGSAEPTAEFAGETDMAFEEALRFLHRPGVLEEQEQYVEVRMLWKTMLDERYGRFTPKGTGYVVDSLFAAVRLNRMSSSYERVVRGAIAFGHDTDTTACIAGPIAVLRGSGIPEEWLGSLAPLPNEAAEILGKFGGSL